MPESSHPLGPLPSLDPLDPLDPVRLLGQWQMTRDIDDRHAGQRLRVVGTLTLTPALTPAPATNPTASPTATDPPATDPPGIDWVEAGSLYRPGAAPVTVARRLHVVRRAAGWWVLFDDGRDFHPWRPGARVEHPCGPDVYRGLVAPVGAGDPTGPAGAWRVTWDVSGPLKDYTMRSTLQRLVE